MKLTQIIFFILVFQLGFSQVKNKYQITFENAVHHEAQIQAIFPDIKTGTISLRMSRTSPGRYALHEFAKNVYNVKITDSKGNNLVVTRPNLHQWDVSGHDGTVKVSYTLFADRGDGTYSQIDETHAHLNIPATFMYAPSLENRPVEVLFNVRKDLNWKIATQLVKESENKYTAPNLSYFMDSPVEISDYTLRTFKVNSNGKDYDIKLALHHIGTKEEVDIYFEKIKKIVEQERAVFGEYPKFDTDEYIFLTCYMPQVSGDGMEHRNSTILTSTNSLSEGGMETNIGTVSHEFFHAWNVERIRPKALEPFDFEEANMSGELWFAEGFTSYYTKLILCRAGIISEDEYITGLAKGYNYVWKSPGRKYFNPIEMSYQAPFVDAAKSVDPVNRDNTFISYYSYGSMLGLALDLSLRNYKKDLNLDHYMQLVWEKYGKSETPYTIKDLQKILREYSGDTFANDFFEKYIFDSQIPDYKKLFSEFGISLITDEETPHLGVSLKFDKNNKAVISKYPKEGSPAYTYGLDKGDIILTIDSTTFEDEITYQEILNNYKPGDKVTITYQRLGKENSIDLVFGKNPKVRIVVQESASKTATSKRENWLKAK